MKNNLDPVMQARLDKWRSNPLPVKSLLELRRKGVFLGRKQNHWDVDTEEETEILKKLHNNPGKT